MIENKAKGYGEYWEVSQDEFLQVVTSCKWVVCHFYHNDFERCKILDLHLRVIAQEHLETKFISMNVEKAPFFVEKLFIKQIPTTVFFDDGVARDRIIGYEGVSDKDDFPTILLSRRLVDIEAIEAKNKAEEGKTTVFMGKGKHDNWSDDEESGDD